MLHCRRALGVHFFGFEPSLTKEDSRVFLASHIGCDKKTDALHFLGGPNVTIITEKKLVTDVNLHILDINHGTLVLCKLNCTYNLCTPLNVNVLQKHTLFCRMKLRARILHFYYLLPFLWCELLRVFPYIKFLVLGFTAYNNNSTIRYVINNTQSLVVSTLHMKMCALHAPRTKVHWLAVNNIF